MTEDDRSRRRLGEATRQRIDELAAGWNLATSPGPDAPVHDDHGHESSDARFDATLLPRPTESAGTPPPAVESTNPRDHDATLIVSEAALSAAAVQLYGEGSRLRDVASLPRRRGFAGDIRYVFTAAFGVSRARRELAATEAAMSVERARRRDALGQLAAIAVSQETIEHPLLPTAREELASIEDRRARHAGAVASAEEDVAALRRELAEDQTALDAEIARHVAARDRIAEEMAPLEREVGQVRRRAADHKAALAHIADQISNTEGNLAAARMGTDRGRKDQATLAAELAALRAEHASVAREEPALAAALEAVAPRLAVLEVERGELEAKLVRAREAYAEADGRVREMITALDARRVVEDRAVADGAATRQRALEALGERLYADRPSGLEAAVAAVHQRDIQLGELQRRMLELREVLSSVDRSAVVRGAAVMAIAVAAVATSLLLAAGVL